MIKVATIKMGQYHASEHYRIEGPFKELANQGLIEWIRLSDDDIAEYQLNGIDIFFFWNPSHPKSLAYVKAAKNAGCKVWIDFDDDWENVPLYHPHTWRTNPNFQIDLNRQIVSEADVVTVTTMSLFNLASKYNNNVYIVVNALHNKINVIERDEPTNVIGWRGSDRHIEDIREGSKGLIQSDKINYHFIGICPWFLIDKGIVFKYTTWSNSIQSYFNNLLKINMEYCWWPLINNRFNNAISNNAWLEATMAGAVMIVPQWLDEHIHAPNFIYKNHKQLTTIIKAIENGELEQARKDKLKASVTLINKLFILEQTNAKRYNICKELVEQK
jgi:hypothetical protein